MLFPTVTFAVFFVVVFAVYWSLKGRAWKPFLLVASWVFYGWWDWRFVPLLLGSILLNYILALGLDRYRNRWWLVVGVTANLILLGFFKYFTFVLTTLVAWGWSPSSTLPNILVPIGVSFFTFEAISYQIELRRGTQERMTLLDLATYMSFFPKITSGPITRPTEFMPQLESRPDRIEATTALWLIARGLFKKVVLASFLSEAITSGLFSAPGGYAGVAVLIGIYAYTMQIYLDFSAYVDMAIGLALLLGFRLPENFDRPYTRITVTQFWAHWHMTLTRWMRDYVYTPFILRGKGGEGRTVIGLMLIMLLVGVWHGAGWTFVVFGLLHGVVMSLERIHRVLRRRQGKPPIGSGRLEQTVRWLLTFHLVALGWVFFGAGSIGRAFEILGRLGAPGGLGSISATVPLVVVAVLAVQFLPTHWTGRVRDFLVSLRPVYQVVFLGVALLVIDSVGPQGVLPFIYFRF